MDPQFSRRLAAIGFRLAGLSVRRRKSLVDIEEVLLEAAAVSRRDGRLMSLLFSWVHVHADHVIVEKLRKRLSKTEADANTRLVISALAGYAVNRGRHKWRKLIDLPAEPRLLSASRAAESAVQFKGAEPWLSEHRILAAKGSLRIRPDDVLSVKELAGSNRQYRNRLLYGASWRADIITAIEDGARTAAEISRRVGCSYEPAHRVRKEYLIAVGH